MRGGRVQLLRDLLVRYSNLTAPEGAVLEVFVSAVKEVCGISLQKNSLKYSVSSKTIGLSFSGPRKTEIQLHAREILAFCKNTLGEKSAPVTIV